MYIEITSVCNMSCAHCCFGYGNGHKGQHMTMTTFHKVMEFAEYLGDELLFYGGGEATLHPNFWEMIGVGLSQSESLGLVTNGSQTTISLKLAKLLKREVLDVSLSIDSFHDPIDSQVVEAFEKLKSTRNTSKVGLINAGNALLNGIGTREDCVCEGLHIHTNGDVNACGCKDSLNFGNVTKDSFEDISSKYYEFLDYCGDNDLNQECSKEYLEHFYEEAC